MAASHIYIYIINKYDNNYDYNKQDVQWYE